MPAIIAAVVVVTCALIMGLSGLHTVLEHERGVVLRFGKRGPILSPGLNFILPFGLDHLVKVDLRSTVLRLSPHEVVTVDGVPLTITASVHMQVVNPLLAVTRVADYRESCMQVSQAALVDVASRLSLRSLLTDQALVRDEVARFVDDRTAPWGVQVTAIDVEEIVLPAALRRAMEQQVEAAVRVRIAQGASAGEQETTQRLVDAAQQLSDQPHDVQMRYLEAVTQIGENTTVVVVPLPVDLVQPFINLQGRTASIRDVTPRVSEGSG